MPPMRWPYSASVSGAGLVTSQQEYSPILQYLHRTGNGMVKWRRHARPNGFLTARWLLNVQDALLAGAHITTAVWLRLHQTQSMLTDGTTENCTISTCARAGAAAQVEGGHHAVALLHTLDLIAHVLHNAHELQDHDT